MWLTSPGIYDYSNQMQKDSTTYDTSESMSTLRAIRSCAVGRRMLLLVSLRLHVV